ncbi:hypothetical protein POTOM_002644 [Populus tomentosa]|uniref:Uncharacterized protein n=1 Tax=Populus tomentosa TaxID=118781 RepID=A0A8X8DJX7_POPTO|nr:hypothetical protein POTOM_002644 [Populus tomentosa]
MGWGGVEPKRVWVWVIPSLDLKGFGLRSSSRPKMGVDPSMSGSKRVRDQKEVWILLTPDPIWVRLRSGSRPKRVWFLPCSDPKWIRVGLKFGSKKAGGLCPNPKRFGSFCVRTQEGLGLGPFESGPNMGWVDVLPCLNPKGFRMGLESEHKGFGFGVGVQTQNRFGYKSFHFQAKQRVGVRTQGLLGLGLSVSGPKGVWVQFKVRPKGIEFGSFCVKTQNGFRCGTFPIRTQEGLGLGLGPSVSKPKGVRDGFEVQTQGV